jgi:hypothetical protein
MFALRGDVRATFPSAERRTDRFEPGQSGELHSAPLFVHRYKNHFGTVKN